MTDEQPDPTDLEALLESVTGILGPEAVKVLQQILGNSGTLQTVGEDHPLEPLLEEAKPLLADFPEESEEERQLTGLVTRLGYLNSAKQVDLFDHLSHLAFHTKELTKDEGDYQVIMALCAALVESTISYCNALLEEALTCGLDLGMSKVAIQGLMARVDGVPDTNKMAFLVGREMAKNSAFFTAMSGVPGETVVRLYSENPHQEGTEE